MTKIRTRFAPSPTGRMHVGNLRTALYAYLIARHYDGEFLIRIEDTDQERYVEGAVDIIYRTMDKAGLHHDEGPDKEGDCGPYVQSERQAQGIYLEYAKKLVERKEAYYCFCDHERLASLTQVIGEGDHKKEISIYDKHCLHLSEEEVEAKLALGIPWVIRQNNPREGTTYFDDQIYGRIEVNNQELDDMVLIKSDGYPTYNFANVVDDHLMGITHVVRGNEYLSSTPKYNRLYEAFGWEVPTYIHCPLITDENHNKLSKRSGHSSFEDLLEQGFLPEAIINYVALLGWSPEDNQEIFSLKELEKVFNERHISKSPAVFDIMKLRWMNGEYLKAMSKEDFLVLSKPIIDSFLPNHSKVEKMSEMVRTRIDTLVEIPEMLAFFKEIEPFSSELYNHKKMKCNPEKALEILPKVVPVLEEIEIFDNEHLFTALSEFAKENEYKVGLLMWPIRIALSGREVTPAGATEILEVLGKAESIQRIKDAILALE